MSAPGVTRMNDYAKVIHLRGDFLHEVLFD